MPLAVVIGNRAFARQPCQTARLFVKAGFFLHPLGNNPAAIIGRRGNEHIGLVGFGDPRRPVNDQRRGNICLFEQHFRLEQFQLKPHGTQFFTEQKFGILKRQAIGFALRLRGRKLLFGKACFLFCLIKAAVGNVGIVHPALIADRLSTAIGRAIFHRLRHVEMEMIGMCRIVIRAEHGAETFARRLVEAA